MDRLGAHLGLPAGSLWVKRDDLTGLAGGGNKTRKLEYLCFDALDQGADTLVTGGGEQSNHCRQTAAAAAKLGLKCSLVLAGERPDGLSGNLMLDRVLGADITWVDAESSSADLDGYIEKRCLDLSESGARPYNIPVGGSNAVGALGYVKAAMELRFKVPEADLVVVATGSCGTHAGLVAGFMDHERVLGIRVGEREDLEGLVSERAAAAAALAGLNKPAGQCRIDHGYLGEGYAKITDGAVEAIELAARLEGLILDPVYTGKALAGLIGNVRSGQIAPGSQTVFMHTGGMPGLLSDRYAAVWSAQ
ncbi:MAG: D-cysteine desulfhydrase family protein [Actinobacteria bacterium]|nr:D-cysteine desulfhydrase family protein [Actinomycetota bacterium]